jgi:protein-S-isoprenylcysteine O-methyltransferase Ste14
MYLGRSFGIFVSVREIVLRGPYHYVRHPIYLGYIFIWAGLVLANRSVAIVILVAIHTALLIYRARLEEEMLAEASPAYREYMTHTGFLFPKLRRRPSADLAGAPDARTEPLIERVGGADEP